MFKYTFLILLSLSVFSQADPDNFSNKCTVGQDGVGDGAISICLMGVNKAPTKGSELYKKCNCESYENSESEEKSASHCQIPRGEGKSPGVKPLVPIATGTLTPLIDKDDN